ncbi:uncharacterized protein LOC117337733 [Pecten maximus]|uniref:uncharacterized protein LOC117337733 n=1 Tax=Pecten maximus TaxID=6579 RepID=UPI001458AD4A|nr:uncharacterized protein LOC117337733 [Pecten maximus]
MGTKRDIPAIDTLKGLSREWSVIGQPLADSSFDVIQQHRTRMSDLTTRTKEGVTKVQEYVDEVGKEVSAIKSQVKSSLIENVQKMSGLVNKLVPTKSYGEPQYMLPSYGGNLATPDEKGQDNEMIARHMEEEAENLKQMQNLESFLGKMEHLCEKVRSYEGIDSEEIKNLQDDLKGYGDTLENEHERQQREEKQKRERERAEEEERKRIEEENRRRNPANWKPLVLKDRSNSERFANTDVLCVVYAMDGSFTPSSLRCTNMEGHTGVADWLSTPYEQQASSPTKVSYNSYSPLDLQEPMEVYVPYLTTGANREPEVKISIDNGKWEYPEVLNERKIDAFPKSVDYIGTKVPSFESFKLIVSSVLKKRTIVVDKNGVSFKADCMHVQIPPNFGNDKINLRVSKDNEQQRSPSNFLGAQMRVEVDCIDQTTKDIDVKISPEKLSEVSSHFKDKMVLVTAANQCFASDEGLANFRLDTFRQHLQTEGVINTKETNDNKNLKTRDKRIKHLIEMILEKPSAAEKVLECLDKSGNKDVAERIREVVQEKRGTAVVEEQWRSVMVFREDGENWRVIDPKRFAKLHQDLGCTLQAGHRHFDLVSLTVSKDSSEKDIERIADEFGRGTFATKATLICRHKSEDYQAETFLHVLPANKAALEISRLKKQGYTRGPMELADFDVMDGDTVELYMSGNIGIEYSGRRIPQGEVVKLPFKTHKDVCKANLNIYVVDKKSEDQMDDDRYRGLLHYRIKDNKPLKERTDSVELVWMKTSKRYLSHLSMNGDIQALAKFIGTKVADRQETHDIFAGVDTPAVVKEIEQRVERQCKSDTNEVRLETAIFIWANQNQDEKEKKIEIILNAVREYHWCAEARQFVTLYMNKGLFSEVSLLSMSTMLGSEWQDLVIALKLSEGDVYYIQSMDLSEQDKKGKMLDKYRLSRHAISFGIRLPDEFLKAIQQCKCSNQLTSYVEKKLK